MKTHKLFYCRWPLEAFLLSAGLALLFTGCSSVPSQADPATRATPTSSSGQGAVPEPSSWSFPAVIESARAISPRNVEGREFDRFGLAYPPQESQAVDVSTLPAQDLQKYADIVTHAYPDAVFRKIGASCDRAPVESLNTEAVAGVAYVSIHAVDPATRQNAAECLDSIQGRLKNWRPTQ